MKRDNIRSSAVLILKFVLLAGLLYIEVWESQIPWGSDIPARYTNAFWFFLTSTLVVDLSRIAITRLYTQKRLRSSFIINKTFLLGIRRIASAVSAINLFISLLILFDVKFNELFTSLSIIAAALAITFKDYISNFINGLIIMFSDELSLGDDVEINKTRGKIIDITFVNTHLLSDDQDNIYIPNNVVMNSETINFTQRETNRVNFEFELDHKYLIDLAALEALLVHSIQEFAYLIDEESYNLKVVDILKDKSLFKFQYTLNESNRPVELQIRRILARRVVKHIQEHNLA